MAVFRPAVVVVTSRPSIFRSSAEGCMLANVTGILLDISTRASTNSMVVEYGVSTDFGRGMERYLSFALRVALRGASSRPFTNAAART
jgi:hypothetical protein